MILLPSSTMLTFSLIDESWVNNGWKVHQELLLSVIFLLSRFSKFNLLVFFRPFLTKISLSVLVLFLSVGSMFLDKICWSGALHDRFLNILWQEKSFIRANVFWNFILNSVIAKRDKSERLFSKTWDTGRKLKVHKTFLRNKFAKCQYEVNTFGFASIF